MCRFGYLFWAPLAEPVLPTGWMRYFEIPCVYACNNCNVDIGACVYTRFFRWRSDDRVGSCFSIAFFLFLLFSSFVLFWGFFRQGSIKTFRFSDLLSATLATSTSAKRRRSRMLYGLSVMFLLAYIAVSASRTKFGHVSGGVSNYRFFDSNAGING